MFIANVKTEIALYFYVRTYEPLWMSNTQMYSFRVGYFQETCWSKIDPIEIENCFIFKSEIYL